MHSTGSDRGIEYQLFARVTRQLSDNNKEAPDFNTKQAEALHYNLKLWTKLAVDVANENNKLPSQLRSNIFYLAEFTRHHTAKIYQREANTDILVEINTSIMRGLRNSARTESEAS